MSSKPAPTESLVSGHGNATVTSMSECPKRVVNRDVKCPESRERETKGAGRSAAPQAGQALPACTGAHLPGPELGKFSSSLGHPLLSATQKKEKNPPLAVQHGCVSLPQSTGRPPNAASPSSVFLRVLVPVHRRVHASCRHASSTHPARIQHASSTHPTCIQHASSTHPAHIQHASSTHPAHIQHATVMPWHLEIFLCTGLRSDSQKPG